MHTVFVWKPRIIFYLLTDLHECQKLLPSQTKSLAEQLNVVSNCCILTIQNFINDLYLHAKKKKFVVVNLYYVKKYWIWFNIFLIFKNIIYIFKYSRSVLTVFEINAIIKIYCIPIRIEKYRIVVRMKMENILIFDNLSRHLANDHVIQQLYHRLTSYQSAAV